MTFIKNFQIFLKKIGLLLPFFLFFSAFGKEAVIVEPAKIFIDRKLHLEQLCPKQKPDCFWKKIHQKIEAQVPILQFPYKDPFFEKVKEKLRSSLSPFFQKDYILNAEKYRLLLEFKSKYSIGINDGKLFTVRYYSYSYTGGAHGNSEMHSMNIDIEKKVFIKFFDVFRKEYLKDIKRIVLNEMRRKKICDIFEEDYKKFVPPIFLREKSIEFIFSKYEVTPGACDSFSIEIPIKRLKKYIRKDFLEQYSLWK